jgi:hypothetical protein
VGIKRTSRKFHEKIMKGRALFSEEKRYSIIQVF